MAKNNCQKKPNILEILGTKVVQFWCYTKLIKTKKLLLNWYFSTKIFIYFWPFNKSHEKINTLFLISAIIASIWNVFIKFRWHDEKFTPLCDYLTHGCSFGYNFQFQRKKVSTKTILRYFYLQSETNHNF